jgi:cyanate lyase
MAANVADLCRERELTVDQLTEQTGLEKTRITAILLGRWTPSPQERRKIADVFDIEPDQIAWGHKTPIQHIYGHGPG